MIKLESLTGVGLVLEENVASEEAAELELERAFAQGSQGWGVRADVGVLLKVARDLKIALALAATADENGRMLKGAQMESGRIKKQRDELAEKLDVRDTQLAVAKETYVSNTNEIDTLRAQLDSAYNQLAAESPMGNADPTETV